MLYSQTSSTKKANLVLCVLYPNTELPWLGQITYLGPKTTDIGDPRIQTATSKVSPFPVGPAHLPSFHSPSTLLWAKESVLQVWYKDICEEQTSEIFIFLQTDVSKVIRYSRKLPDKEASLIKVSDKVYNINDLLLLVFY